MTGPLLRNSPVSHGMSTSLADRRPSRTPARSEQCVSRARNLQCHWQTGPVLILEDEVIQQY